MTFNPIDDPVDHILLANTRSPGLATIDGASTPRQWDQRRGYGLTGSTVIYRGNRLSPFVVQLKLLTTQDWEDWEDFRQIVQRAPAGERSRAMDIWHPILVDLGIVSVVIEDVTQPRKDGDTNVWLIDIKCLEFRLPVFDLAQPEGSDERPDDPVDRYIEELTGQVQELAA